jgi:hypothetical protein
MVKTRIANTAALFNVGLVTFGGTVEALAIYRRTRDWKLRRNRSLAHRG